MSLMDYGKKQCSTCGYYGPEDDFQLDGIHSICTCAKCLAEYDLRRLKSKPPAGF
jgi:hypothetical protein